MREIQWYPYHHPLTHSCHHTVFDTAGINMDEPLVATCGSGVTAAIIAMAAHIAYNKDVPVYDVSSYLAYNISSTLLIALFRIMETLTHTHTHTLPWAFPTEQFTSD